MLGRLDKCAQLEEKIVPLLSEYLDRMPTLTELEGAKEEKMREYLNILKEDSVRHAEMVNNLKQRIVGSGKDEY